MPLKLLLYFLLFYKVIFTAGAHVCLSVPTSMSQTVNIICYVGKADGLIYAVPCLAVDRKLSLCEHVWSFVF